MSPTHDYVIANGTGSSVRSDINDALAAVVSQNSSSTAPATTYAYMIWVDTTTNIVKMRNGANSAWIELFETDGEFGSKTFNGNITLNAQGDLRFADSDSSNWVAFQAPATVASNVTWTLPSADGTANQTLVTNGSGTLSWATPTSTSDKITEGNTEAEVVDTGSDGHFKVTTEGTERFRCDSSGRLLLGTSSARANFYNLGVTSQNQIEGTTDQTSSVAIIQNYNAATYGAQLILAKSNALSIGSNTLVASGDACGRVTFQGNDGTDFVEAARIEGVIDGTPGANDMPGRLVFSTTADGASSPTERMRLASNGDLTCPGVYSNTTAAAANVVVSTSPYYILRSTSSIKYKTNVEDIDPAYSAKLLDCRPVWFRSTCSIDNPNWSHWGFIAEEVASIDPRLVHWKTKDRITQEDGTQIEIELETPEPEGVQYDRFVPHLLNLIKRQQQAIEDLQAEVAALKAQ